MDKFSNDQERERTKITLSLGIIAMSVGLISLVGNFVNTTGYSIYIYSLVYSTFGIASLFLIIYIIRTAAHYKSREEGKIDEYYISDRTRNFFYDEAINTFGVGFYGFLGAATFQITYKLSGNAEIGLVLAGLLLIIFLVAAYLLSRRARKIDKIK